MDYCYSKYAWVYNCERDAFEGIELGNVDFHARDIINEWNFIEDENYIRDLY